MGRFYKTASPQMVDFMYKIPEQAILKAIEGTDKQIDTENLYVTESQKLLQKKALSPDEARQKEILAGHQKGIDEVSQLLASSPLAALKDRQRVRDLQKKIYEDVTRGELSAQYKNYDIRQKHYEEELKRATNKDGSIRVEDLEEAMRKFDEQFAAEKRDEQGTLLHGVGTSYDPTTGKYKTYGTEKLVDFYDRKEEFAKIAKDWKPSTDTDVTKEFVQGNYYVTTRNKDEILPAKELTFGIYKTMMYDPKAMEYYKQKAKIRSGGNKELYNQEMTRLFGERIDPGNPFSAFKMKEVKDANGKVVTEKVQKYKYDKNGNVEMKNGKPVIIEEQVPVMEMANPGELFMAAQAAAEKEDINKTLRSTTLDATEAYTTALQQQKDIAVAKAKYNMENQVISIDMKNNQIVSQKLPGNNFTEIKQNLQISKDGLSAKRNQLKENYLKALNDRRGTTSAAELRQQSEKIMGMIDNGQYKQLKQYLNQEGIALPGISQLTNELEQTQRSIDNNQRLFDAQLKSIENTDGYKKIKAKVDESKNDYERSMNQIMLNSYIEGQFNNKVTQEVKTIQGEGLKKSGIIDIEQERKLNEGFKFIESNTKAILSGISNASNAIISKLDKDNKVVQSFTTWEELLKSYKIPLSQDVQITEDADTKELVYSIPNSKEKLAIKINRASVVEGNTTNYRVTTGEGKTESVNLGQLPINMNFEILKIDENGRRIPEKVDVTINRENLGVNAINEVLNDKKVSSVQHVQTQLNLAKSNVEGISDDVNYYHEDDYGVKIYPNQALGFRVDLPDGTQAFGKEAEKLYLNYIAGQKN